MLLAQATEAYIANIGLGGNLSFTSLQGALREAGIQATVQELEVDGQKLLPTSVFSILENELYDLDIPLTETADRTRAPVTVIVG